MIVLNKTQSKILFLLIVFILSFTGFIKPQVKKTVKDQFGIGRTLISLNSVLIFSQTDYSNTKAGLGLNGQAEYFLIHKSPTILGIKLLFGGQTLRGRDQFQNSPEFVTDMYILGGGLTLAHTFDYQFYPYIYGGVSNLWFSPKDKNGIRLINNRSNAYSRSALAFDTEAGARIVLNDKLSIFFGVGAHFIQSDNIDDITFGSSHDSYYSGNLGISLSLFGEKDSDNDGIPDSEDACPSNAEDYDGYQDDDGCPDRDNDGDKIIDSKDNCPNEREDFDGFQDDDGCPELDNDNDGIPDVLDKCPNQPENFNGFEDNDGCPDILTNLKSMKDSDNDGFPDELDKCPEIAETLNGFQDDDGCPDSVSAGDTLSVKEIPLEGSLLFDWRSSEIKPTAFEELNKLVQFLEVDPFIKWVVESYTDNNGNLDSLKLLSQDRAISLIKYFIDKGLPSFMFKIAAKGAESPIADNFTLEGRIKNNRIVLRRLD